MRLKFSSKRFLMDGHVEQQKKKFQVDKWASKHARLLFTTSCSHPEIIFFAQDVFLRKLTVGENSHCDLYISI